jgi:hypothetical protein
MRKCISAREHSDSWPGPARNAVRGWISEFSVLGAELMPLSVELSAVLVLLLTPWTALIA